MRRPDDSPCGVSAVYGLAARLAASFRETGWCAHIAGLRGGGLMDEWWADLRPDDHVVEQPLSPSEALEMAERGFLVVNQQDRDTAPHVVAAVSVRGFQRPLAEDHPEAVEHPERSARLNLGSQLSYTILAGRFAQAFQWIVTRDDLGGLLQDEESVGREMNVWLSDFRADGDVVSPGVRRRRPLRKSLALVLGKVPGGWRVSMAFRPHPSSLGRKMAFRAVSCKREFIVRTDLADRPLPPPFDPSQRFPD